jgi:hypothetical protein
MKGHDMSNLKTHGDHDNVLPMNDAGKLRLLRDCAGCFAATLLGVPSWQASVIARAPIAARFCAECGSSRGLTQCHDCGAWTCNSKPHIANQYSSSPSEPSCGEAHAMSHQESNHV